MTQADLIAALPEGRLPPELMGLGPTDLLALFGAGLMVSALLSALAAPFLARRPLAQDPKSGRPAILPTEERLLAIARIIGHLPDKLRSAAYGSEAPPSDETIERIALKSREADR